MKKNKSKVYGVGSLGQGIYSSTNSTKTYKIWISMLDRCYSEKTQLKHKSYVGCTVCQEWLDFQNFARFYELTYKEAGWQLDKDILGKGLSLYSPQTCCFVPPEINKLFVQRKLHRGNTPIGVHYEKSRNRFKASMHDGTGKTKFLGRFHTATEAFYAYKEAKEQLIKIIAEKYRGRISDSLYNTLINYKINISD